MANRKPPVDDAGADAMESVRYHVTVAVFAVLRSVSRAQLDSPEWGKHTDLILVLLGIYMANHEGRPISATGLASFLGMPRSTAERKIKELVQLGFLERQGRNLRIKQDRMIDPRVSPLLRAAGPAVIRAARAIERTPQ